MFNKWILLSLSLLVLTGCAAGSATAGYALRANCADNLSAAGEERVVERAKREIFAEMSGTKTFISQDQ